MPLIAKVTRCTKVHIKQAKDREWYFVLTGGNGQPIAVSETYTRRSDALRGAERFCVLVAMAEVVT